MNDEKIYTVLMDGEELKQKSYYNGKNHVIIKKKPKKLYNFVVYSDGGCKYDERLGAWAYYIKVKYDGKRFLYNQYYGVMQTPFVSPIYMELTAILKAFEKIEYDSKRITCRFEIGEITCYSDSIQIINSKNLYDYYINNNWVAKQSNYQISESLRELWYKLNYYNNKYNINYVKIKAHTDVKHNNTCDIFCKKAINKALQRILN
jgi:ribonuclease HI